MSGSAAQSAGQKASLGLGLATYLGPMRSRIAPSVTGLLESHRSGDVDAFSQLVSLIYPELTRIARAQRARCRPGDTMDTVAVVNEAYIRLVAERGVEWRDRAHFFAIAAKTMRRVLVDRLRRKSALKRGGGAIKLPLSDRDQSWAAPRGGHDDLDLLALDRALHRLEDINPRLASLVDCRFFGGLTETEAASLLDVSVRTVQRDWIRARAWLRRELTQGDPGDKGR